MIPKKIIKALLILVASKYSYSNRTRIPLKRKTLYSMPDEELSLYRENVRQTKYDPTDLNKASKQYSILHQIDSELIRRAWGNEKPHAPSMHREHGWYLDNDE